MKKSTVGLAALALGALLSVSGNDQGVKHTAEPVESQIALGRQTHLIPLSEQQKAQLQPYQNIRTVLSLPLWDFQKLQAEDGKPLHPLEELIIHNPDRKRNEGLPWYLTGLTSEALGTTKTIRPIGRLDMPDDYLTSQNEHLVQDVLWKLYEEISPLEQGWGSIHALSLVDQKEMARQRGTDDDQTLAYTSEVNVSTLQNAVKYKIFIRDDVPFPTILGAHELGHVLAGQHDPVLEESAAFAVQDMFAEYVIGKRPDLEPQLRSYFTDAPDDIRREARKINASLQQKGFSYPEIFTAAATNTKKEIYSFLDSFVGK